MNFSDPNRNAYMLCGPLAKRGYLRWWHSFRGTCQSTGITRSFFIEYLILNPVPGNPKKGTSTVPSYVSITAGSFPTEQEEGVRLSAYYPISAAKYAKKPLYFQVDENILSEHHIAGYVEVTPKEAKQTLLSSDAGTMEWNLEMNKTIACHTGPIASPLFCALNALDSFWHAEGIRCEYRGTVLLNGQAYQITPEESFGYADKHWGHSYNKPWLQLASCSLYSQRKEKFLRHSALAIDGCCPRFLFLRLKPKLMLQLTYTGEDYCFSFARPFSLSRLKWCTKESRNRFLWQIHAQNLTSLAKVSIQSSKSNMLLLQYDDPNRSINDASPATPPLWAGAEGLGTIELYRITSTGKEWIDTLTIHHALCEFQKPVKSSS